MIASISWPQSALNFLFQLHNKLNFCTSRYKCHSQLHINWHFINKLVDFLIILFLWNKNFACQSFCQHAACGRGLQIFQKSRTHLKTLVPYWEPLNTGHHHTKFSYQATCCPGFVHTWPVACMPVVHHCPASATKILLASLSIKQGT